MTKFLKRGYDNFKNWSATGKYKNEPDIESVQKPNYLLHIILLFATFITLSISGLYRLNLIGPDIPFDISMFFMGFPYSVSLLAILGCHEFGHYFAAVYHRIKTSLPYFLPAPPILLLFYVGTFGAVIRLHEAIKNRRQLVDIGAYGPIAGFVVAILVLFIGVATLPPIEYIYTIHANYRFLHEIPDTGAYVNGDALFFGKNIIFHLLTTYILPYKIPMSEIYHYPLLLAGWIGLFITALNLLPFGQLDGGHILYAVAGKKIHLIISWTIALVCLLAGIFGYIHLFFPDSGIPKIWAGWLVWGLVLLFIIKPWHPPVTENGNLNKRRILLAWISLIIFVVCFTPIPFDLQ